MNNYISFIGLTLATLVILGFFAYEHKNTEDITSKSILSYSNTPPPKSEPPQQSNPHYDKTLFNLAVATTLLVSVSKHYKGKDERIAEISAAQTEIRAAQKLLAQPHGGYASVSFPLISGNILDRTIKNLITARDETLVAEENILSPQIKILVRAHIQAAIDKVVELQNAEQKSQPQKSTP